MHSISKQQEELTTETRTETEYKNSLDVDLGNKITTESRNDYVKYLPENALHPIEMGGLGFYDGPSGKESYWTANYDFVSKTMTAYGFTVEKYPYWIREDGCQMLGEYIICAANIDKHPYGSLIETSLGTGIVCDTGGSFYEEYSGDYFVRELDIATIWK